MVSVTLPGLFTKTHAERIKQALTGKSYMNFSVECGGYAHNYSIVVSTNCPKTSKKELFEMFIYCALCEVNAKGE